MAIPPTLALVTFTAGCLSGAVANAADDQWQHTLTLYMVAATVDGKSGIGNVTADVDASFGDILDNLDAGAMLAYRGERGPWAITLDLIYLGLEGDRKNLGPSGQGRVKVVSDQTVIQLDVSKAISEQVSVYGGIRYWDLDVDIDFVAGGPLEQTVSRSGSEDWADPLVGLRYATALGDKWQLVAKGDMGGFGIGSDFTWHVTAFAAYAINRHANVLIGYRYLDVDYDDGSGEQRFLWDVAESGPMLGFAWAF